MTTFEICYLCLEPFFPPLQRGIRAELKRLARSRRQPMEIVDVGGRFSNYTIGVPALITVTDLPRNTEVQESLHLGATDSMMDHLLRRRSNVRNVHFDDMTSSNLPSEAFDCIVAVEVLEHVDDDQAFVREVARVMKRDGRFIMTTPNGEAVPNVNPDHKRHYSRQQLLDLLLQHFSAVRVEYAIPGGLLFGLGLRSWTWRHPLRTAVTMLSACLCTLDPRSRSRRAKSTSTNNLIAWCSNQAGDR